LAQDVIIHFSGHDLSRIRACLKQLTDYDLMREHRIAVVDELTNVLLGNGFA
jgi:hypothetical protein